MKLLVGKWYVAVRLKNDRCVGLGRPSQDFLSQADLNRPHGGF